MPKTKSELKKENRERQKKYRDRQKRKGFIRPTDYIDKFDVSDLSQSLNLIYKSNKDLDDLERAAIGKARDLLRKISKT